MNEVWKVAVTKYGPQHNLMASSLGRIKRLPCESGPYQEGRIYELKGQKYGHISIAWSDPEASTVNGRRPLMRDLAHRIIALTFLDPPKNSRSIIRHRNGNAQDNRPENLAWGTRGENSMDRLSDPNSLSTNPVGLFIGHNLKRRIDHAISKGENEREVLIEIQTLINKFVNKDA